MLNLLARVDSGTMSITNGNGNAGVLENAELAFPTIPA